MNMKENISAIKKDSLTANIALLVLYPYSILTGLQQMQGVHIIYPAFVISILIYVYIGRTCGSKLIFKKFVLLLFAVLTFLLFNMFLVGNTDIKNIVYGVFILPCLGALLFFYRVNYWVSVVLFYSVAIFLGIYVYENGFLVSMDNEILLNSRNYMSYFVIVYSLPYFVHCHDYNKTPSLLIPTTCVLIAIYTLGRTGIVSSMLILVGVLYIKMTQKKSSKLLYRGILIFAVTFLAFVGLSNEFIDTYFSRFAEEGLSSAGRTPAWIEYLDSLLNPVNFLLGTKIETLKYTSIQLNGSLHNSFLTLHAREGVIGFILVFYLIMGTWYLFKNKCYPVFIVIVALLFKGLTDADMGGTYSGGDIYVFYLALIYIYYSKKKKYERKSIGTISATISSCTRK